MEKSERADSGLLHGRLHNTNIREKGEKMGIQIITDSAADYSVQEIERRGIICVPMTVTFGDEVFQDSVDLAKEAFFERLAASKEMPKTAQPSPSLFLEHFEKAKAAGDSVIVILISGELSGTIQAATIAKDMAEYEDIHIIDSRTATLGMRILVDRAAYLRKQGVSVERIVAEVEALIPRIRIYAGLETLEYLYKGGRVSKSQAAIGNLVNLKPVICVADGKVELFSKQIGLRHVNKVLEKVLREECPDEAYPIYFLYSYDKKNCAAFIKYLAKNGLDYGAPKLRGIGATIGSHIGTGAYGVVYVK